MLLDYNYKKPNASLNSILCLRSFFKKKYYIQVLHSCQHYCNRDFDHRVRSTIFAQEKVNPVIGRDIASYQKSSFAQKLAKVKEIVPLPLKHTALCSRNFQNAKLRQYCAEILEFSCRSDFT